ncbi:MAG: hypothetical protein LBE55_02410 [Clostridiales bacterium]|jgi:hypothetical protein|nr:hypothetical protein [Clostridiales bacterium]
MNRAHETVNRLIDFDGERPFIDHFYNGGHKFAFVAVKLTEEERDKLKDFEWTASSVIGSPNKIALFLKIKPFADQNTSTDPIGDFVIPFKNRHVAVGWRRRYDDLSEIDKIEDFLEIISLSYLNPQDVIGHIALNDTDLDYEEAMGKIEIPDDVLADDKNHMFKLRLGDGAGTSVGDGYGFKRVRG